MTAPLKVIGVRTRFLGTSGGHPYLVGYEVVIVAVLKDAHDGDPDSVKVLKTDEEIAAAGGIDPDADRIEVAPLLNDSQAPAGKRPSFATSDAQVGDLELFAAAVAAAPAVVDPGKAEMIRHVEGAFARTGRRYRIKLDRLDVESLREMLRLMRDLDGDKDAAVRRARIEPWRR